MAQPHDFELKTAPGPTKPALAMLGHATPSLWEDALDRLDGLNGVWNHPKANRQIRLQVGAQAVHVGYWWSPAKRRTIGMQISAQGLQVRAPRWVDQLQIEAALQARAQWIVNKLGEQRAAHLPTPSSSRPWAANACFAYRGQWVQVALGLAGRQARLQVLSEALPLAESARCTGVRGTEPVVDQAANIKAILHLPLTIHADSDAIATAVQRWLRQQALDAMKAGVEAYAPSMGVRPARLALTSANTRWGSASSSGSIRLHWRLIQMPPALFTYVLVHELAHLQEMNHSPQFWAWVARVLPEYEVQRQQLRQVRLDPWA